MANRTVSVILQAEIGNYVANMTKAAVATKGVGESAQTTGAKVNKGFDIAGRGALLLGGAVAGALVGIISKSMDFEKSMSAVQAATQASVATLGDLRDAAMQAGADTQYSATEAADAITEMAKAGVSAADIMGGGLTGALSLAAAGQIDVAEAAGIASVAMTQFGLAGGDLPHVADLLAAGAGKAMGSVDDLGMALNQAGLVASATGLSIEETTGTLAAFASAGLLGSDAGTSLKTMLQKLQNPSKEASDVMSDLGINMYNASGNFVGMSDLAGQLQTKMAGLTQAERDKAMATIFGSDAVRAANVLYTQGAKGIESWTSKVNDAGYAQRQAAQLTDNLAGDLERLGGSFDTLLIEIGQLVQGPLRALTQGLGWLIDGPLGLLPDALSLAGGFIGDNTELALALATVLAVQLAGGISAVTVAFNQMILTPVVLGLSGMLSVAGNLPAAFAAARAAVAGFVAAAAPLVAVGAIVYAIGKTIDFATAAGDAREEIAGMWDAVDDARGAGQLDALAGVIDQIQSKIDDLKSDLGDVKSGVTGGLFMLFNGADVQALEQYEAALEKARATQVEATRTATSLGNQFGLNRQQVLDLADKYDIDLTVGAQNAYLQFQRFYTTEYGKGPDNSTRQLIGSLEVMADKTSTAEERVDALKTALDLLGGKQVSVFEATSALQQVVDSAAGALEGLTGEVLTGEGHLNAYSESGRAAGDVLVGVRDKGNDLIATMISQGSTLEEVMAKDAELRDSFIKSAMQMGISEGAAHALADEILGVPEERKTRFEAQIDPAMAELQRLQLRMDEVARNRSATITVRAIMPDLNGVVSGTGRMGTYAEGGNPRAGELALVGERGPELVRFGSDAHVFTATETRSIFTGREVSGASHAAPSVHVAAPSLDGMRISGSVAFDPSGMLRFVDARIDSGMGELADSVHYAGGN